MFGYKPRYVGAEGQPIEPVARRLWDGLLGYKPRYRSVPAVKVDTERDADDRESDRDQ